MCRIEEILTNRKAPTQRGRGSVRASRRKHADARRNAAGPSAACMFVVMECRPEHLKKEKKKERKVYSLSKFMLGYPIRHGPENRAHLSQLACSWKAPNAHHSIIFFVCFSESHQFTSMHTGAVQRKDRHQAGMPNASHALLRTHRHAGMPTPGLTSSACR